MRHKALCVNAVLLEHWPEAVHGMSEQQLFKLGDYKQKVSLRKDDLWKRWLSHDIAISTHIESCIKEKQMVTVLYQS